MKSSTILSSLLSSSKLLVIMNNAIKHYNVLRPAVLVRLNLIAELFFFITAVCGILMGVVLSQ